MDNKLRGKASRVTKYVLAAAGVLIACGFVILASMMGIIPDTVPQDYAVSPDGRTGITVVMEAHGTFGPINFIVRIGPENSLLNVVLRQKLIEMDVGEVNMLAPTVTWTNGRSAIVYLSAKPEKLAGMIGKGLYPKPAADHYGAISIAYRPQPAQMINGQHLGPLGPLKFH
jgi:hypothetical protein